MTDIGLSTTETPLRAALDRVVEDARIQGMAEREKRADTRGPKTPAKRTGRPTRLHQGLIDAVVERVRAGEHQDAAAAAVGIPTSTYHSWKSKGNEARLAAESGVPVPENRRIFVDFLEAVEQARGEAESRMIQSLQRAAIGGEVVQVREWVDDNGLEHREATFTRPNVAAMTWWLERAFPQRYARRVEVSGPEGGAIPVEVEVSARDILKKKLGQVADRMGPPTEMDKG